MAVYNVEAVNEALNNNESILDSLEEACDYMLGVLDESKARQKYVENRVKEAEKAGKEAMYAKNVDKVFQTKETEDKADKTFRDYSNKLGAAARYSTGNNSDVSDRDLGDSLIYKHNMPKNIKDKVGHKDWIEGNQKAERQFRSDHGIPNFDAEDKSVIGSRKPGSIKKLQDQKRAIKETCLHILSIIDDIE